MKTVHLENDAKFDILSILTENERNFYEKVLLRGQNEGLWRINKFVAGGGLQERTAFGVDFIIRSQITGVILNIEYKLQTGFWITKSQQDRFLHSNDLPDEASRLIVLTQKTKTVDGIKEIIKDEIIWAVYLSPTFLKVLPNEAFTLHQAQRSRRAEFPSERVTMSIVGLEECFKQNRNNVLADMKRNEFGSVGARYFSMKLSEAYKWVYEKLKKTMLDPLEDEKRNFVKYKFNSDITIDAEGKRLIRNKLLVHTEKLIKSIIKCSYRPLFPEDLMNLLAQDEILVNHIYQINNQRYIRFSPTDGCKLALARWISQVIAQQTKTDGELIVIRINNYVPRQYGIKNRVYFPLKKGSSQMLDLFKRMYEETGKATFTIEEFMNRMAIKRTFIQQSLFSWKSELHENNLIKIIKKGRKINLIQMTELCMTYIMRKFLDKPFEDY